MKQLAYHRSAVLLVLVLGVLAGGCGPGDDAVVGSDQLDARHAAPDRHRHEDAVGRARHDVENRLASLVAGRDIEKADLVGFLGVVSLRREHGITGIA